MSQLGAAMYARNIGYPTMNGRECRGPYVKQRWFKASMDYLIDPFQESYFGLRELEVFGWMVRVAGEPGRNECGVAELLSCQPTCLNFGQPRAFGGQDWRKDLARRFRYALSFGMPSRSMHAWREANGIKPGGRVVVPGPSVNPYLRGEANPSNAEMTRRLAALLGERGWLAWSLNDCHPRADRIQAVQLSFSCRGAGFSLDYGYNDCSSSWGVVLASQEKGESLLETLDRATDELARLKDPDAEPPLIQKWASHGGKPARPAREAEVHPLAVERLWPTWEREDLCSEFNR
jgi:hypothetical protein